MTRIVSRAESWDKVYEAFAQVNFAAFDYNTVKQSLIDYVKLYFPEDFNDYIESSEFIAQLELFAYIAELMAYRYDLNAHENFLETAQRKESVLRIAKMLSYPVTRNLPARGFVKMTSIQTTEQVVDAQGRNLSGRSIVWNDPNNPDWKEQFFLVMNRVLAQTFGTVSPNDRVQIDDVLFELYELNNNSIGANSQVFKYSVSVSGVGYPMELVPVTLTSAGPEERRPERNLPFSLLYASDGLGDSSNTTGFLMFTKQGTLVKSQNVFDGATPNQTLDIEIQNINNIDVWLNNINSVTGEIFQTDPTSSTITHQSSADARFGEWVEVDLASAQNVIFNTTTNRHKYEIETLDDDQIRLIFGDGEFSDIPNGTFDIWYRISGNTDLYIPQSAIVESPLAFTYNDSNGNVQTVSATFTAISGISNGAASESIEHIRRVAPAVYYTQDRMVSGQDYNSFMLQDPSILKMKALNRTFAGDSKYIAWHDPSGFYENVKIFGDDLALYWLEEEPTRGDLVAANTPLDSEQLTLNFIEPLLSSMDMFLLISPEINPNLDISGQEISQDYRRFFHRTTPYAVTPPSGETTEWAAITTAIDNVSDDDIDLYYSAIYDEWTVGPHPCDTCATCPSGLSDSKWMMRISARFEGAELQGWDVRWRTKDLVSQSQATRFWQTNQGDSIVTYDTLNSNQDNIVVLRANPDATGQTILSSNVDYNILNQMPIISNTPNQGLPDIHRLSVITEDVNNDGVPDNINQEGLMYSTWAGTWQELIDAGLLVSDAISKTPDTFGDRVLLPYEKTYLQGCEDIDIQFWANVPDSTEFRQFTFAQGFLSLPEETQGTANDAETRYILETFVLNSTVLSALEPTSQVRIYVNEFMYLQRTDSLSEWIPVEDTNENKLKYLFDEGLTPDERLHDRWNGRYPLNFAWFHRTPQYGLIDPAASNIIDMFVVTRGYYTGLTQWIDSRTDVQPTEPTPLNLRTAYGGLLENKMISDTVILHSGKFKILFGGLADQTLKARLKVIRPVNGGSLTDNEVKSRIADLTKDFFDIEQWEFGETFYFTELAAVIHSNLGVEIDSVVIVPLYSQNQFGDLFQVQAREDELFIADISPSDIDIVQSYNPENLRQES